MTMANQSRRAFLADVGRGMLVASVGAAIAADLGLVPAAFADDKSRAAFRSASWSPWPG